MSQLYQVKWFSRKSGYGFVSGPDNEELFCHHSDIRVDGYKYLKRGEIVMGTKTQMDGGKSKLADIKAVTGFQLMCQVDKQDTREPREGDTRGHGHSHRDSHSQSQTS
jgi:cold shock CspA family protein